MDTASELPQWISAGAAIALLLVAGTALYFARSASMAGARTADEARLSREAQYRPILILSADRGMLNQPTLMALIQAEASPFAARVQLTLRNVGPGVAIGCTMLAQLPVKDGTKVKTRQGLSVALAPQESEQTTAIAATREEIKYVPRDAQPGSPGWVEEQLKRASSTQALFKIVYGDVFGSSWTSQLWVTIFEGAFLGGSSTFHEATQEELDWANRDRSTLVES